MDRHEDKAIVAQIGAFIKDNVCSIIKRKQSRRSGRKQVDFESNREW
jgi:hypothetical protein